MKKRFAGNNYNVVYQSQQKAINGKSVREETITIFEHGSSVPELAWRCSSDERHLLLQSFNPPEWVDKFCEDSIRYLQDKQYA